MNKSIKNTVFLLLLSAVSVLPCQAKEDYSETIANFEKAPKAQAFFTHSYGYAVFPTIGKGGLGLGGAYGSGQVYKQGRAVGMSKMYQLSIGFQAGGQAYSQMVFFQDKRAFNEFTAGNFEFTAGASAIAITASAQAQAGTSGTTASTGSHATTTKQLGANYHKGFAVLTVAKGGLMYEASLAGQKYSYEPLK